MWYYDQTANIWAQVNQVNVPSSFSKTLFPKIIYVKKNDSFNLYYLTTATASKNGSISFFVFNSRKKY